MLDNIAVGFVSEMKKTVLVSIYLVDNSTLKLLGKCILELHNQNYNNIIKKTRKMLLRIL